MLRLVNNAQDAMRMAGLSAGQLLLAYRRDSSMIIPSKSFSWPNLSPAMQICWLRLREDAADVWSRADA